MPSIEQISLITYITMKPNLTNPNPDIYLSDNYLVIDVETTREEKGTALNPTNSLLLSVTKRKGGEFTIRHGGELEIQDIVAACEEVDFIIAHNAKFDLQWLRRAGLDLTKVVVFDTMIAEKVIRSNLCTGIEQLALKRLLKDYKLGKKRAFVDACFKHNAPWVPNHKLDERCRDDVSQTEALFKKQLDELVSSGRLAVLYTRCLLTPVLADIEFNGMCLDGERVAETYSDYTRQLEDINREIESFSGGINFRSSKQVGEFIYGPTESGGLGFSELTDRRGNPIRTAKDKPKTDNATLEALKASNRRQRQFIDLRKRFGKVNAALTKTLHFFYGVVKEKEGIFYGDFNQCVTKTQRLSASGRKIKFELFPKAKSCQFQNMPRKFKSLFTARNPGWVIPEADGAQLEFRSAAHQGLCSAATEAIRDDFDVHSFTASMLNGIPFEDFDKKTDEGSEMRQDAKAHTFKPLYGGESGTELEQAYYKKFKDMYPGIKDAQEEWKTEALTTKQIRIPSGLIFYFPNCSMSRSGYINNTTEICNYPVQSYATADIIPIALVYLWHGMKQAGMRGFIVNTIHDSVISEIPQEEIDQYRELVNNAFTEAVYQYLSKVYNDNFTVPLAAGLKFASHWSEPDTPEEEYSMEPPEANE